MIKLPPVELLYLIASALVAVGIWVQIVILRKNAGKMPESSIFYILSLIDSAWVLVSGLALYFLDFDKFAISVPVVYGIYTVLGFFYAAHTMGEQETLPSSPDEIEFDGRYLNFCQSFALVFFGLCMLSLYFFVQI